MDDGHVIIRIDGDDKGYKKVLNETKNSIKEVNKVAKAVALGVTAAGTAVIGLGVKFNAEMEQYQAGFTTLLGSAEKADKTIQSLKSFAEKTPFELTDLANAGQTLLAFGEDVEDLMPDIKMLGDISLGNKEKFKSLALVFGQVRSQGRLMGQDLLQMINAGFNPLQIISEKTGESVASLKEKMSEGQISFEMVAEAMKIATSEGGQFYNAMETQSKTFMGQVSTLKDDVVSFFGDVSATISSRLTDTVLPCLIEQVENLREMWNDGTLLKWLKGATTGLAAFGAGIAALNVSAFITDIVSLAKGVKDFTAVTKAGTVAQAAFNLVANANPYVLVATALAALVGGIVAFNLVTEDEITVTERITQELEDLDKQLQKNIKSIEEKQEEDIASIEVTEKMFDRLIELDKELKENSSNTEENAEKKAELKSLVDELNKVSPAFKLAVDNETGALANQSSAIQQLADDYINLAKAKAYAEAYAEKAKEYIKANIDLDKKEEEAENNLKNARVTSARASYSKKAKGEPNLEDVGIYEFESSKDLKNKKNVDDAEKALDTIRKTKAENEKEIDRLLNEEAEYKKTINELSDKFKTDENNNSNVFTSLSPTTTDKNKNSETPAEKAYRNLKHEYEMGLKSTREYYNELGQLRDRYYNEGEKEYQEISEEIKELKEKDAQEDRKSIDEKFRNLKYKLDTGKIDEKEYYETLDKYRREYFDEGSEEWQQHGREIHQYHEKIKQQIIDNITELEEKHKNLANKLKGYASLFSEKTTTFYNADGEIDLQVNSIELTDFKEKTDNLVKFSKAIDELKERTNLPEEFFSEIINLDSEQGLKVINEMLSLPQEELNAYTQAWKEFQNTADKVSADYYKEEFSELKSELVELFGELPEDFFEIGEDSGEKFGNAFMKNIKGMLNHVSDMISSSFGSLSINATVGGGNGTGGITTSNVWNIVNNLVSKGTSIASEINEMNTATIAATQRSGY